MQKTRDEVIKLLQEKNNSISVKIIEEIELFDVYELNELKLILKQTCPEKLKEAYNYKSAQLNSTIEKITEIGAKTYELDKMYKQKLIEDVIVKDYEEIEEDIEFNLEQAYLN